MGKIFVAYARDESFGQKLAIEVEIKLRNSGFEVFRDVTGLKPGDVWYTKLELELETSDLVVLVVSKKVRRSKWVHNEISMAEEIGLPVIPILAESMRLPLWIAHLQCLDFSKKPDWESLLDACKSVSNYSRSQFSNNARYIDDAKRVSGLASDNVHSVRALLLGPGGAGKSSLADRLQCKPVDQLKIATQGIEYLNHQPLDLVGNFPKASQKLKQLNLYLWDFGGQTIFHGLHHTFLNENCIYILVVDSRHEQAPDEWLHQIRHLTGRKVAVFLVTNQHEGCNVKQNEKRLLRQFPNLLNKNSFHYFSCIKPDAFQINRFVEGLVHSALESQKPVPKKIFNIYRSIHEEVLSSDTVFFPLNKIKKIVNRNNSATDLESIIDSMEQLGFLTRISKGKLSYCLKPEWAVDRAYELLYSDILQQSKGVLNTIKLDDCFKETLSEEQQVKLLDFLEYRSLCFEVPSTGHFFFPDACTSNEPNIIKNLLDEEKKLVIRFDLPYLPLGFHTRLVKPLFNTKAGINDNQNIWRQGFITQLESSYGIAQYLFRKGSIEFTLVGNPKHYAQLLKVFNSSLSKAVGESKSAFSSRMAIMPFVYIEKKMFELDSASARAFSVHSVVELVKVLSAANGDLEKIYDEVRDMASNKNEIHHHHGDSYEMTGGDGSNFSPKSKGVKMSSWISNSLNRLIK